jgi:outer membrane protein
MTKLSFALVLAAPSLLFAQSQTQTPTVVTLDDAIRIAEQSAPSMRNSRNSVRIARFGVTRSYAAFLPSINTSASFSPAQNGANANYSTGISASLGGLFNQNTYFAIATARRGLASQEAAAVTATFQLRAQVKQQYFAVLQAQEQLAAAERQLVISNRQLELVRVRVASGMAVANDSMTNAINVMNQENSLITANNTLANSIRTFSRTLGIETLVQPDPRDTSNFQIVPLDSVALFAMLYDSPQAVQSRTTVANSKHSLRMAKLAYIPTLSGGVNWSRSGSGEGMFGYGDGTYRYSGGNPSISFNISLPVFDRFSRENSLMNARESLENAELNSRDQRLNQESTLLTNIANIRSLEQQLVNQQLALASAEENLRIIQIRYELDLITDLEVLTAQNTLINQRNSLITLRNNYRNAIAQLEQLVGRELR